MAASTEFPCSLVLTVPFPTQRLASTALQSLQVDKELSPLVRRTLTTVKHDAQGGHDTGLQGGEEGQQQQQALRVEYSATTNRMLRVAVNSFLDSLNLVVEVMQHLDIDVLEHSSSSNKNTKDSS
ncbi:hypothetical protein N3K66_001341 [Trichothecium roseum]|uniref:Uncharacterized protein n=1 Tax=Trichothecium roseum TaxID=47278 RepID=A0ACC0VEC2_9HYPO|nr:hypothetical protein N3K66_001341 [Trichothecium roseum]